jgi:peptidoglycan/LPS O-acetylase OafA/YrhL
MSNSSRLLELDALRGIAAISVVLYHYTTVFRATYGHHDLLIYFPYGGYGVNLFFIISGFVIFLTLEKVATGLDFIVGRFSRLFPAYWIAIGLTSSVVFVFGLPGQEVELKNILINLTMLEQWLNTPYIDEVYWSLSLELSFYVLMFILYKSNMLKRIEIFAITWLILFYIIRVIKYIMGFNLSIMLLRTSLFWWVHLFIAGIIFYKIKNKQSSFYHHAIIGSCLLYSISSGLNIIELIINIGFFGLFYMFCCNKLKLIVQRPLLFLGMISYPLYLIHYNIGFVIIYRLESIGINANISVVIAMALSLLLSWLIHLSVEKPAMQFIRTKYRNVINRNATAPLKV